MDLSSQTPWRSGAAHVARLAPFFILGPVSGPLTAGVVVNFRGGRPFLASLYGIVLAGWLLLAPIEVIHMFPTPLARFL
jgi:hypothetical protein